MHMNKFFNLYTSIMLLIFVLGLIVTGTSGNWTAFIWIITGLFWMLYARCHELSKENLKVEYEELLSVVRKTRDGYIELYSETDKKLNAQLQKNIELFNKNKELELDNERLKSLNRQPDEKVTGHGNIKVKVKKKKTKTE